MKHTSYPLAEQPARPQRDEAAEKIQVLLALALREYNAGRLTDAEQLCLQILAVNVRHAEGLHLLGMIGYQTGRYEIAVRMIRRAVAVNDGCASYHLSLGNALQAQGKLEEAAACFERALAINPDNAEAQYNLGNALQAQGKLEAAASCFERALAVKPEFAEAQNNLGIALQAQGKLDKAVACYEGALAIKPEYAEAQNNLGNALQTQGKLEAAAACYERALAIQPEFAEAQNNLGAVFQAQGKLEEAAACYERSLAIKPDFAEAQNNLGFALHAQGKLDEAVACYERALAIKPDYADAQNNLGISLQAHGNLDEAVACYERALAIQPDYADAHWNRSLAQLLLGDFAAGWRNYEWRSHRKNAPRSFPQPLWRGEPLHGRRILLHAEQGLGDSLQFLRYVPMVQAAGGTVVLNVPDKLRRIAAQLPGVAELVSSGDALPHLDCHCPLMSLPLAFGTTLETIPARVPYLSVPKDALEAAAAIAWPATGLRVGLVWAGSPTHPDDHFRSMPFSLLEQLFDVESVHFFSLQMGPAAAQPAAVQAEFTDLAPVTGDMADTAAQISHLDLVITVDTSVAHMAGALAKPTWVLLSSAADWRWLRQREDSPWYPTMRLFRQPKLGDWHSVVKRVRTQLCALADAKRSGNGKELAAQGSFLSGGQQQELERRRNAVDAGRTDFERWADERQLERAWDARAQHAANYVPAGAAVLDLGCGRMALEEFLPADCRYIPCDLVRRDERTILCDFNAAVYPDTQASGADLVSLLGVLEYIFDARAFLLHLRQWQRPIVMSYCATDGIGDRGQRRNLGWVNNFSHAELTSLLGEAGFSIERSDRIDNLQWLFRLRPNALAVPALKRVAVLSLFNVGNFGDRLGYHLVNDLLPAHAEVTHLSLRPWAPSSQTYDLLIVGIGNSIFGPFLDKNLLSIVDRSRAAIGIFGTQYPEALQRPLLKTLVDRLDHWYARNEEDVLRYGRDSSNVSHLGDWMIGAFPMTRPTCRDRLDVGEEMWNNLPLDRTIQNIQRYATVFSSKLHPLLCALTSADRVGYREQREAGGTISGKFRSLFLDIFGRSFPEEVLFEVDRSQVITYKRAVENRVLELRARIHRLLDAS
jgi:tetratricopeptide (TPR) repeat protein